MEIKNVEEKLNQDTAENGSVLHKNSLIEIPILESRRKKYFLNTLKLVLILVIIYNIVEVIKTNYISTITISGHSMDSTLYNNEVVLLNKFSTKFKYKDIVVFESPIEHKTLYVKRIIGVPNDTISFKNGHLYINGIKHEEDYVNKSKEKSDTIKTTDDFELSDVATVEKIPEGYYFVLGDNRLESRDSREFGLVSENAIRGKVVLNVSNLSNIKKIN